MSLLRSLARRYSVRCLLLIVAYYIAGRTSLLLAISAGFASPVWPAAGVALGAVLLGGLRYAPAVFAAAFITNLMIALEGGESLFETSALVLATAIAIGATLQASIGAALIWRLTDFGRLLDRDRDVAMLFLIGGPVVCTICASFGVTALYQVDFIPLQAFLFTWFTWWVGDSIGVLIVTPVMVLLLWPRYSRNRKLVVLVPSVFVLIALITVFAMARDNEAQARKDRFAAFTQAPATLARNQALVHEEILRSLQAYLHAHEKIDRRTFDLLALDTLARHKQVAALYWAPAVADAEREQFETSAREEGFNDYRIIQLNSGERVIAEQREVYFPVLYCKTLTSIACTFGVDMFKPAGIRATFEAARDAGIPIASEPFELLTTTGYGMILALPVFTALQTTDTIAERREHLRGFVFAVVRINELAQAILDSSAQIYSRLHVIDNDLRGDAASLFGENHDDAPFVHRELLEVSGRQWTLAFTPTAAFMDQQRSWGAWFVLIGGLIGVSLIQMFLLSLTARTETIRRIVDEKTAQLVENEAKRENLIQKLTDSNQELERFAYVCSHDLQEPLRTIGSFADRLHVQFEKMGIEDDVSRQMLFFLRQGATRAQHLITDVLAYSGIEKDRTVFEPVDLDALMATVRETLAESLRESGGTITTANLPVVHGKPMRLAQLLQNLVNNGLKYQAPEQSPRVHVEGRDCGDYWEIAVRDNGIGISAKDQAKIFDVFQRLHRNEEYAGTGVGLSICKKVVQLHGGRIWVESETGQGSTFKFTLAKKPTMA